MKVEIVLLIGFATFVCGHEGFNPKILYRIRSGFDGAVLTADKHPKYANDLSLILGDVTTQDWYYGRNQLWTISQTPNTNQSESNVSNSDLYWMKPVAGVLNSLTGAPGKEISFNITEITENSGTFTIQNVNGLCLENEGIGLKTIYKPCNEFNTAHQWDFEDPKNLNPLAVHIRLFNQLLGLFI